MMKKISLYIMIFTLVILLTGCEFIVVEQKSVEYNQLSNQYDKYIENDLFQYEDFKDFVNNASDQTVTSVFTVERHLRNSVGVSLSQSYGNATLIYDDMDHLYLITTYDMLDMDNKYTTYDVYDAYGNQLEAEVYAYDHMLNLAILSVEKNDEDYNISIIALYIPLSNELALKVTNDYPIQNQMKLGFVQSLNTIYVEIKSDAHLPGSPVFNSNLELIGIEYMHDFEETHMIMPNEISIFFNEVF